MRLRDYDVYASQVIHIWASHLINTKLPSFIEDTVKPDKNGHSQKDQKLGLKTNYRLMQVKSIAECSNTFDLH